MPLKIRIRTYTGEEIHVKVNKREVTEDYIGFTGGKCFEAASELRSKLKSKQEELEVTEKPEAYVEEETTVQLG